MTSSNRNGSSVAEIRADRDEARRELGDTVEQLAAKADVAQHAKDAVASTTGTVKRHSGAIAGGLAAVAAAGASVVLLVRRRRTTTVRAKAKARAKKARAKLRSRQRQLSKRLR
jgi:hypothetical protein